MSIATRRSSVDPAVINSLTARQTQLRSDVNNLHTTQLAVPLFAGVATVNLSDLIPLRDPTSIVRVSLIGSNGAIPTGAQLTLSQAGTVKQTVTFGAAAIATARTDQDGQAIAVAAGLLQWKITNIGTSTTWTDGFLVIDFSDQVIPARAANPSLAPVAWWRTDRLDPARPTVWPDIAGTGHDMVVPDGANGPTLVDNAVGPLSMWEFAGSAQQLLAQVPISGENCTVLAVFQINVRATTAVFAGRDATNTTTPIGVLDDYVSSSGGMFAQVKGATGNTGTAAGTVSGGVTSVLAASVGAGPGHVVKARASGRPTASTTPAVYTSATAPALQLQGSGAVGITKRYGELVVLPAATDAQIEEWMSYLCTPWAVTR